MTELVRPFLRCHVTIAHQACAALCGLAGLLLATAAGAQPVLSNIAFDQIDWFGVQVPAIPDSEWGDFSVDVTPGASIEYINVLANTGGADQWIVRNLPTIPSSADPSTQRFSTSFDLGLLGVARGVDIVTLDYRVTVDAVPRTSAPPAGAMTTVGVGTLLIDAQGREGGDSPLEEPGAPPDLSTLDFTFGGLTFGWHLDVPNIDLDDATNPGDRNGCGPAAAANSLKWLGAPDPLRTIFEDISDDMGRGFRQGVTDPQFLNGKLKYINDEGLGLVVKFQDEQLGGANYTTPDGTARGRGTVPTFDFIRNELDAGEDVELGMTFYRCSECVQDGNDDLFLDIDAGNPCTMSSQCDAIVPGDMLGLCRAVGDECELDDDCPALSECRPAGGHWVTVTGSLDIGFAQGIWTKDDGRQAAAGGTRTQFSWLRTRDDGFLEAVPGFPRHKLDVVVSESPVEAPALGARGLAAVGLLVAATGLWMLVRRRRGH